MPVTPSAENERQNERQRRAPGRRAVARESAAAPLRGDADPWAAQPHRIDPIGRRGVPDSVGRRRHAAGDASEDLPGGVPDSVGRRRRAVPDSQGRRSASRPPDPAGHGAPVRPVPPPPVDSGGSAPEDDVPVVRMGIGRRFLSLLISLFSVLVALGLICGAQTPRESNAVVVFGIQILFVAVWTVASRPPAPRVVAGVGLTMALGTDAAVVLVRDSSLEPLAYLTAAGFVLGVLGQLLRPAGRVRVTESLGSSLVISVGVVSFATLIELASHARGTQALVACVAAAGIAVAVARMVDVIIPLPRIAPHVPRGGLGVVLGAMAGTAAAAVAGYYLAGLDTNRAALAGLATALVAVMVDLSVGYAEAGRQLEGQAPAFWIARHMQGPLGAIAFSAPVAYAASVVLLHLM